MDNNRQIAMAGVVASSTLAAEIIAEATIKAHDKKVLLVEPEIQIPIKSYHIPEILRLEEPNNRRTRRKKARLAKRKK